MNKTKRTTLDSYLQRTQPQNIRTSWFGVAAGKYERYETLL
ncbi:hypothetical protein ACM55G_01010 [Flavobacterium sp. LB3P122]